MSDSPHDLAIGGHAAELISQITLTVRLGATVKQLAEINFAHPTLSGTVLQAVNGIFGQAAHTIRR